MEDVKIKAKDGRNEMHFEVQLKTKSHVFEDRKKKAKGGYRKHKGKELEEE